MRGINQLDAAETMSLMLIKNNRTLWSYQNHQMLIF